LGCAGGPEGLIGVITGRYELPHPANTAATPKARPAWTSRAHGRLKILGKRLIQLPILPFKSATY
jgi:hypothetical protein